ncbi:hypothetical protein AZH43_15020 [Acinetobacter pragensis]|uniref:Uncharacterized protein n=1 Tax=Acinetobacter pragensis TaxID=1806892 RepID=A0A151Y0B0_9GAMM|nr:hypothetical protein AZH43_15020 [Acinetobacter pragensis]
MKFQQTEFSLKLTLNRHQNNYNNSPIRLLACMSTVFISPKKQSCATPKYIKPHQQNFKKSTQLITYSIQVKCAHAFPPQIASFKACGFADY